MPQNALFIKGGFSMSKKLRIQVPTLEQHELTPEEYAELSAIYYHTNSIIQPGGRDRPWWEHYEDEPMATIHVPYR
jgi:hypothetical protein